MLSRYFYSWYNTHTSKHSIVIDIDETLVYSILDTVSPIVTLNHLGIYNNPKVLDLRSRIYFILDKHPLVDELPILWGIKRPGTEEFLKFCFEYFQNVIIWSAGNYFYIKSMVDILFIDTYAPSLVWSYDKCVIFKDTYHKPLKLLINENPNLNLSIEHTFILDDRIDNFIDNPYNGILIPKYNPELTIEGLRKNDSSLIKLIEWFKTPEVINSYDIRLLDKSSIFT